MLEERFGVDILHIPLFVYSFKGLNNNMTLKSTARLTFIHILSLIRLIVSTALKGLNVLEDE